MKFSEIPQLTKQGNYMCDYTLVSLVDYIEEEVKENGLQLNPDFQRGHVWTEEQQIKWIEYHLKGGKSGNTIYLNDPFLNNWGKNKSGQYSDYVVVDGLQRITAAQRFIHNEIPAFGFYFKDYEDKIRILPHMVHVNINNLKTKKEVLNWYIEMNSEGTPHTKEEIERVKNLLVSL